MTRVTPDNGLIGRFLTWGECVVAFLHSVSDTLTTNTVINFWINEAQCTREMLAGRVLYLEVVRPQLIFHDLYWLCVLREVQEIPLTLESFFSSIHISRRTRCNK